MRKKFLSVLLTLAMVLAMVPATAMAAADTATEAKLHDKTGAIEDVDLYDEGSYKVTEEAETDGVIPVKVEITGLRKHTNANGSGEEGYWVGFALAAPDEVTKVKYGFAATKAEAESAFDSMTDPEALEEKVVGESSGIAFYADATDKETAKVFAKVEWYKGETVESTPKVYQMNLDGVKIVKDGTAATAVEANVAGDKGASVCDTDSYKVTSGKAGNDDVIPVTIVMTNLEKHPNEKGTEAYWTGFALVAPAGATQMKYGFEADVVAAETAFKEASLGALETGVDGGKTTEGIAFYINADKAESNTPKLGAVVQWFDEKGNAIGLPAKYLANIDGVTLATTAETIDAVAATIATLPATTNKVADITVAVPQDAGYTAEITGWKKGSAAMTDDQKAANFAAGTYTATVTLTATAPKEFADTINKVSLTKGTAAATQVDATYDGTTKKITFEVSFTVDEAPAQVTEIKTAQAIEITAPVKGVEPQETIAAGTGYTGTITWKATGSEAEVTVFAADTEYKATVVLTAAQGYKFVAPATIEVDGGTVATPEIVADGSTLTAVVTFPKTAPEIKADVVTIVTAPKNDVATDDNKTADEKTLASDAATAIEVKKTSAIAGETLKTGANDTTVNAINAATTEEKVTEAITAAKADDDAPQAIKDAETTELTTKVVTFVDITVTDAVKDTGGDTTKDTLEFEIAPKYQIVVTEKTTADADIKVGVPGANAVATAETKEAKPLSIDPGTEVEVSLPIPSSFANDTATLYAQHMEGDKAIYSGTVTGGVLTFTTTSGFSPYKITKASPAVASVLKAGTKIGDYATLKDAVAALIAQKADKIEFVAESTLDASDTASIELNKDMPKVTVVNGTVAGNKLTFTAAAGFDLVENAGVYSLKLKAPVIKANGSAVSSSAYTDDVSVTIEKAADIAGSKIVYTVDGGAETDYAGTAITVTAADMKVTISAVAKMYPAVEGIADSDAATATIKVKEEAETPGNRGGHGGSHSLDEIKGGRYDNLPKEDDKPVIGSDDVADPSNPFVDVATSDPYYDAIMEVYKKGWMVGISDNTFASAGTLTRGMAAQILWNKAGNPAPTNVSPFLDVTSDKWYATAIAWAYEQGLVLGYDGTTFGPDDFVTTEQFTIMLDKLAGNTPAPYVGGAANATRGWVANEIVK